MELKEVAGYCFDYLGENFDERNDISMSLKEITASEVLCHGGYFTNSKSRVSQTFDLEIADAVVTSN